VNQRVQHSCIQYFNLWICVCLNWHCDVILFGGSSRYSVRDVVYVAQNFAGALPAHPARM